jgi:hypothetical protein
VHESLVSATFHESTRGNPNAVTDAEYGGMAADHAARWVTAAQDRDHFRLAFEAFGRRQSDRRADLAPVYHLLRYLPGPYCLLTMLVQRLFEPGKQ